MKKAVTRRGSEAKQRLFCFGFMQFAVAGLLFKQHPAASATNIDVHLPWTSEKLIKMDWIDQTPSHFLERLKRVTATRTSDVNGFRCVKAEQKVGYDSIANAIGGTARFAFRTTESNSYIGVETRCDKTAALRDGIRATREVRVKIFGTSQAVAPAVWIALDEPLNEELRGVCDLQHINTLQDDTPWMDRFARYPLAVRPGAPSYPAVNKNQFQTLRTQLSQQRSAVALGGTLESLGWAELTSLEVKCGADLRRTTIEPATPRGHRLEKYLLDPDLSIVDQLPRYFLEGSERQEPDVPEKLQLEDGDI